MCQSDPVDSSVLLAEVQPVKHTTRRHRGVENAIGHVMHCSVASNATAEHQLGKSQKPCCCTWQYSASFLAYLPHQHPAGTANACHLSASHVLALIPITFLLHVPCPATKCELPSDLHCVVSAGKSVSTVGTCPAVILSGPAGRSRQANLLPTQAMQCLGEGISDCPNGCAVSD